MTTGTVAITTVYDGSPGYECAILQWCTSARRLASLLLRAGPVERADLAILRVPDARQHHLRGRAVKSPPPPPPPLPLAPPQWPPALQTDCGEAQKLEPGPELVEAISAFRRGSGGCQDKWGGGGKWQGFHTCSFLYKWAMASLVQYTVVVFADLDVQLLRPEQPPAHVEALWRRTWAELVPADGAPRFFGAPDHWSPFNAGQWTLSNPSRALYAWGLEVLRTARWNATHGFALMGKPKQLAARSPLCRAMLGRTRALLRNTWDFYAGDSDQGFFFYLMYVARWEQRKHWFVPPEADAQRRRAEAILRGASSEQGGVVGIAPRIAQPLPPLDASEMRCRAPSSPAGLAGQCPHYTRHYIGNTKPWALKAGYNNGRVAHYLRCTEYRHLVNRSRCATLFDKWDRFGLLPAGLAPANITTKLKNHGKYQRLR